MKHTSYICPKPCNNPHCKYCSGSIVTCTTCGATSEIDLTTNCPGIITSAQTREAVAQGYLDYTDLEGWYVPSTPRTTKNRAPNADAAQHCLCEDEGCPSHGTPHICLSFVADAQDFVRQPPALLTSIVTMRAVSDDPIKRRQTEPPTKPGFYYARATSDAPIIPVELTNYTGEGFKVWSIADDHAGYREDFDWFGPILMVEEQTP